MGRMTLSVVLLPLLLSAICIHCANAEKSFGGSTFRERLPCPKAGFFIVPDSCQDYYECRVFRGSLFPVPARCPPGRIFDDAVSNCRPKKFVTSPLRCVQESALAMGGSFDTTVTDSSVDAVVGDSSVDAGVGDSSVDAGVGVSSVDAGVGVSSVDDGVGVSSVDAGVGDSSADDGVGDSYVDTGVGVSSVDTFVNDSRAVANNTAVVIEVDEITVIIDQDSPPPTEGNVAGNGTGASEVSDAVGQGISGASDPSVNETVLVDGAEIVSVPDLTICDHISSVERYVTLVISNPFLKESFDHEIQHNENVMKYKMVLESAQNNTALWRRGDSILTGVKKTYQKASEYKTDFNRKLVINKRRIQDLAKQESDLELYNSLVRDIENLREDIKSAQQALPLSDVPSVRQYFENLIASKQRTIERKQQEMKFTSRNGRELGEFLTFLESVRGVAKEVENLAKHWQEPMAYLHGNLEGDSLAFKNYASRTTDGILALTIEEEKLRVDLRANVDQQERLENQRLSLNNQVNILSDRNWDIIQERSRLLDVMENKIRIFHDKMEELCQPDDVIKHYIPTRDDMQSYLDDPQAAREDSTFDKIKSFFESAKQYLTSESVLKGIAESCDRILEEHNVSLDLSEEREIVSQLSTESKENHKEINRLLGQLDGITRSVRRLFNNTPPLETRLKQINSELSSLRLHKADLSDLQESIDTSIESLPEIMEELQVLQAFFESLTSEFDGMMARGNAAKSDEDIRRERLAIETNISNVQSQVDQLVVLDIETCTFGL